MKIGRMFPETRMTYRGIVANGVVVLEGAKPEDGTVVEVFPIEVARPSPAELPSFGLWRDRAGMTDSGKASLELRAKVERHDAGI